MRWILAPLAAGLLSPPAAAARGPELVSLCDLVARLRPELRATGVTTACLRELSPEAEPRPLGPGLSTRVRCQASTCAGTIESGARRLGDVRRRLARLARHWGAESETRHVPFVVTATRASVSVYWGTSSYTPGAANSRNTLGCATYDRRTGRRLRLHQLTGRRTRTVLAHVRRAIGDSPHRLARDSFRLEPRGRWVEISLCAPSRHHNAGTALEVPVLGRWRLR